MFVDIKNLRRKVQVFNLETEPYLSHPDNGKGNPCSITFFGLETKKGLPEHILKCDEIKNALNPPEKRNKPTLRILKRYRAPYTPQAELESTKKKKKKSKKK